MENLEDNHRVRCDARTYNPFVLPREIIPILRILICPFPIPGQDVAEPIRKILVDVHRYLGVLNLRYFRTKVEQGNKTRDTGAC